MSAPTPAEEAAVRLAALMNEIEQSDLEVYTVGSSVAVGGVKVVQGNREGEPWTVESDALRSRVMVESPHRYLRSPQGTLHLRRPGPEDDGLSNHYARCGWQTDLGAKAIPEMVSAHAAVCKRCVVIEP